MAVNSCIDELRSNGYAVAHKQEGRIHYYRLEWEPGQTQGELL